MRQHWTRLRAAAAVLAAGLLAAASGAAREQAPVRLTLGRAVEMGLSSSEVMQQAEQAILAAEAGVREAKSGWVPRLDISAQYGRNILKPVLFLPSDMGEAFGGVTKIELGEDNDISAVAAATWNLWTAGRLSSAIGASSAVAEAVRSGRVATADYVRFGVREAYYGVLLSRAVLRISEMALESTAEAVRVAKAGHDQGTVSRFDLLRAEVELENRRAPLLQARNELSQALLLLKRRCGIDPEAEVALVDTLETVADPPELATLLEELRGSNPELRALEHRVRAAELFLSFEKAERWPALQVGANYLLQGQWSNEYYPNDEQLAHSSAVTVGVVWPLFDGLRAKSRIDRARADLRTAEIERERMTREKELAVRVSRLTVVDAIAALQGRREAVGLAEEAYRLAEVRLRNGLATPLERLDAELAMTTARGQYAQALYAANLAEAALELTVGGGRTAFPAGSDRKESGDE